jgi:hypothetical protein
MFDKIKEHNFFNTLNIGKVSLNLKKLIKLKYMDKVLDYNNSISSTNVKINLLNNQEDHYYYNLKRLFQQYQI